MNIFVLHENPFKAAAMHCDKHCVKMIVEYAQLLSTAHRLLDGELRFFSFENEKGRHERQAYILPGETASLAPFKVLPKGEKSSTKIAGREKWAVEIGHSKCYNMTHANHPNAVWTRESDSNYHWLVRLLEACLHEYTMRYAKIHKTAELLPFFRFAPRNITAGPQTPFALAMPDQYKVDDAVLSYQNYYVGEKISFAKWTNTPVPKWFSDRLPEDINVAYFQRTRSVL